jgi:hypothetical protein
MICTLNMKFNRDELMEQSQNLFIEKLENVKDSVDNETGTVTKKTGNFKNFSVVISDEKLYLNGSLTKFYHGNNVLPLSIDEMKTALKMLKEETGLPVYMAEIMRIDVAVNLLLHFNPRQYFKYLKETPGYNLRRSHSGMLYLKDTGEITRAFSFYDKRSELKKNDHAVYEAIKGNNILRIEDRYMKRARTQLMPQFKKLRVGHLLSKTLQIRLLENWIKHYEKIAKDSSPRLTFNVENYKQIRDNLATMAIHSIGGLKKMIEYVDEVSMEKDWNSKKKNKVKTEIRNLCQSDFLGTSSHYIRELDNAIAESEQLHSWVNDLSA